MDRWVGRTALVTGASAGIGAAIAESLVKQGMNVVGCGRDVKRIEALAEACAGSKGRLTAVQCDLTRETDIRRMFTEIEGGVDVCINNAGCAHVASLLEGETEKWQDMINVNVTALCICTREAVKSMRQRNVDNGQIININSILGHKIRPQVSFYSATKHMVTALTEGLRAELIAINSNIRVAQISPGVVKTEFGQRCLGESVASQMYAANPHLQPQDVVDSVLHVLSAPPNVQIHDILLRPVGQNV